MAGINFNLRGLSPQVMALLKREAKELRLSVNLMILKLIEQGIGYSDQTKQVTYHDLDFLIGTWTAKESKEFDENIKIFEKIDEEL